jgi:hypothetical protein
MNELTLAGDIRRVDSNRRAQAGATGERSLTHTRTHTRARSLAAAIGLSVIWALGCEEPSNDILGGEAPLEILQAQPGVDEPSEAKCQLLPPSRRSSDAVARLREVRRREGLAPTIDLDDLFRPEAREALSSLESLPGYGIDNMMMRRGCTGRIRSIHGTPYLVALDEARRKLDPESLCDAYLEEWSELWELGEEGMRLERTRLKLGDRGDAHCSYRQTLHGVPLDGTHFVVHLDAEGRMTGANGEVVPRATMAPSPKLSETEAREIVRTMGDELELDDEPTELVYVFSSVLEEPQLAWRSKRQTKGGLPWESVWISAEDGETLRVRPLVHFGSEVREVWDREKNIDWTHRIPRFVSDPPQNIGCTGDCRVQADDDVVDVVV